jgi:two-component system NtrC family sensor kinase
MGRMTRELKEVEAALAHDLNNCLQVAMGNLEVLRRRAAFVPEIVNAALNATRDAAHLADRLVSIGRLRNLEPRALDLNAALTDLADMIGRTVGDAVRLDLQLAPDAGEVRVDPRCLQLALLELATNARDAMPAGGRLTLRSAPATGGLALIEIADTGPGLPPERAARAFEPVFQPGKPALGLHLVERCAEASGGRVEISSDSRGTRVALYLPSP